MSKELKPCQVNVRYEGTAYARMCKYPSVIKIGNTCMCRYHYQQYMKSPQPQSTEER